jgi:phospholipase/carboxylesterase
MDRREFARIAGAAIAAPLLGCSVDVTNPVHADRARLATRPKAPTGTVATGETTLENNTRLDALVFVPEQYDAVTPWPLLVALHGAGGNAGGPMTLLSQHAASFGFLLVAPDSRASTWDVIGGGRDYGPDIAVIDRTLAWVFDHCNVDPARVYLEGFSDGASYALGVGLTNGDLFSKVIAFSPGFIAPREPHGKPPVFIAHGTKDSVLSIGNTRDIIVPELERDAYDVTFVEHPGDHQVPINIAMQAMQWMLRSATVALDQPPDALATHPISQARKRKPRR